MVREHPWVCVTVEDLGHRNGLVRKRALESSGWYGHACLLCKLRFAEPALSYATKGEWMHLQIYPYSRLGRNAGGHENELETGLSVCHPLDLVHNKFLFFLSPSAQWKTWVPSAPELTCYGPQKDWTSANSSADFLPCCEHQCTSSWVVPASAEPPQLTHVGQRWERNPCKALLKLQN